LTRPTMRWLRLEMYYFASMQAAGPDVAGARGGGLMDAD